MNHDFLSEAPLSSIMRKYSVPCVISLLVGALYNIVDQIFIANAAYLGSYGNAANTVVFPVTVAALAIAVMIGDGCSTFMSMSLGAGRAENARKAVGSSVTAEIIAGLLLTVICLLISEPLIRFFGGALNEQTWLLSKEYFFWIVIGFPFYMFGQGLNPVIRSDGSPRFAMAATLAGAAANIILDPVMIYVFGMGMKGAAIATVIGQIITAALTVYYLSDMHTIQLDGEILMPDIAILKKCLPLGITSFLSQISLVASMAAVNSMVSKYSQLDPLFSDPQLTQIPMAVIGIVMKFFQIVISIVVGTAAGCAPAAAYNTGAGRKDRVRDLFTLLLKTEIITGVCALAMVELAPGLLIRLFGSANESIYYTEFALKTFRIYLSMIVFACVNKASFIYLQALGKAALSTSLSLVREVIFGVCLPVVLPKFFGLDGILFSMPAADIMTFLLTAAVIVYIYRSLSAAEAIA